MKNVLLAFKLTCLSFVPILLFLCKKNGMMIFETRAILDGLFSNDSTFLATPKEGTTKKKSANGVYHSWIDGFVGWSGICEDGSCVYLSCLLDGSHANLMLFCAAKLQCWPSTVSVSSTLSRCA